MQRLVLVALVLVLTEASGQDFTAQFPVADTHYSTFGGHPYFMLNPGHRLVLAGEDSGEPIELIITVLNQTKEITLESDGNVRTIAARVVEEREIIDGALTEVGRFWYARSLETGDIYFFGEEVDFYSAGVLVGEALLWEAGIDGALPGIIMPRTFLLGARYHQNQAPAALDGAENVAMGVTMVTPAGSFSNCVQIREFDLLRSEDEPAIKTYAPGVGVVNDDDLLRLTDFRLGTTGLPAGCSFVPFSSHPFFPISPGRRLVLEGVENGRSTVLTRTVLDQIRTIRLTIAGVESDVPTRLIEERKTADGELVEVSRKLFAQCLETGDVHYFGRETDRYENGVIVGQERSWLAGIEGAEAGIVMPSTLAAGARYFRENAPGVARELALNAAAGVSLTVPAGTFTNCLRIIVSSLLEPDVVPRELTFAPGIGLISDGQVLNLESWNDPDLASGVPILSIRDAVLLDWPFSDRDFRLETSPNLQNWGPLRQTPLPIEGRHQISLPRDRTQQYFRLTVP